MSKRTLLISIPLVALVLNGVGYLIVSKLRTNSSPPIGGVEQPGRRGGEGAPRGSSNGFRQDEPNANANDERGQARRAAGLAALEAGDYQKALIHFTEARVLMGDKAQVDDLLRVTEALRTGGPAPALGGAPRTRALPAAAVQQQPPLPSSPPARSSRPPARRVAVREPSVMESGGPSQPAAAPSGGLLIVATTPRGLLVQVDEVGIDLTPMRTKVRPGAHHIALLDGDRKLYETTVEVKEGGTATLLRDLSSEQAAESARPMAPTMLAPAPVAPTPVAASAVRPAPASPPPASPADDMPPAIRAPAPAAASDLTTSAAGSGSLSITSPGLYGVVWINGRPRGYPPLEVRDLPGGPAKIEVRVNGVQKRSSTVVVKPGATTAVTMYAQETGR